MMEQINQELKVYIETNILPLYQGFDTAHGLAHVRQVLENSLSLIPAARELFGEVDAGMVYAIAAYHDTGLQFGRENHEKTSGAYLLADKNLSQWFSPGQIRTMGEAVEDHRASSGKEPRSVYGRIVSEADRDIDPKRIVRRVMEYGLATKPELSEEAQVRRAVEHIREKYGEGGYMRRYLPCPKNEQGLATLRKWLCTGEIYELCRKHLKI